MTFSRKFAQVSLATVVSCLFASCILTTSVEAVPYASAVRNTTDSMFEFVLNEAADSITISRDGGNEIVINSPAAGRHTFDLEGFSDFEIGVAKNASPGWTEITDTDANLFTHFFRATGIAINRDPSSEFFGTVYVNNPNPAPTTSGRAQGDGIYALTADMIGVDLANDFAVVTDPNDTSLFKAPGYTVDQSLTSSSYRLTLDDGGNVIVADWSDQSGGIKYASPDLTTGGLILGGFDEVGGALPEAGPTGGVFSSVSDEFGPIPLHGSIVSKAVVTGTVGVDLTVWAMDEDLDVNLSTGENANDGNSIWRWDVGSATSYDINPTLVVDVGALGNDSDGDPHFLNLNVGVLADIDYSADHDKWYLIERRADGNEAGLIVVTADGVDGMSPVVDWSSKEDVTIPFGLDGLTDDEGNAATLGVQDIFRRIGGVQLSPDGTQLLLLKTVQTDSPQTAAGTPLEGRVIVIPLDENGIPDITVDDNGTPEDLTDDILVGVESFAPEALGTEGFGLGTDFDAAGNIYHGNNINELVRVFSPGGNTLATTTSAGGFSVMELVVEQLDGDYNDDGVVNAADYVVFRNNLDMEVTLPNDITPGMVDASDYTVWAQNFGNGLEGGSGSGAAVPEPTAALLVLVSFLLPLTCGRRVRS